MKLTILLLIMLGKALMYPVLSRAYSRAESHRMRNKLAVVLIAACVSDLMMLYALLDSVVHF